MDHERKIRIVQFLMQREAGGAQSRATKMAEALRRKGYDVHTYYLYRRTDAFESEFASDILSKAPKSLWLVIRLVWGTMATVWRERKSIVITYTHYPNIFVGLIYKMFGGFRLIAAQTQPPGALGRCVRWLDRLAGSVGIYNFSVANSQETFKCFESYPRAYTKRLKLIFNGLQFPEPIRNARIPYASLIDGKNFNLVSVGRLAVQKNHSVVIAALPSLPASCRYFIVGEGPLKNELLSQARQLGVSDKVFLLDEMDQQTLSNFLSKMNTFVFPSSWETFGYAVLEAAKIGLPVVASDIPTMREVLSLPSGEKFGGLLFDHGSPTDLASKIAWLMDNENERLTLAESAKSLADKYSFSSMVDGYEELAIAGAD